ncbi:MAG: hypothetical protein AB7Q97_04885 [Gammaproteobacteria bacterium]
MTFEVKEEQDRIVFVDWIKQHRLFVANVAINANPRTAVAILRVYPDGIRLETVPPGHLGVQGRMGQAEAAIIQGLEHRKRVRPSPNH